MPVPFSEAEARGSEELLKMMGHVLSAWQGVEHAVFDTYRAFFDRDHWDVAAAIFYSLKTFDARKAAVQSLVQEFTDEKSVADWTELSGEIRKKQKIRNEVAHGTFVFIGKPPNRKSRIGACPYDIGKFPDLPREHHFYGVKELGDATHIYLALSKKIFDFAGRLEQDVELQAKFRARPQRLEKNDWAHPLTAHIPPRS